MKTDRPTFVLLSFWTTIAAVAMFTAAYVPTTIEGKMAALGVMWFVTLLVVGRPFIAGICSDKENTVSEAVVERGIMLVLTASTLGAVYWMTDVWLVNSLTCIACAAIVTVAVGHAHDFSARDVHETQLRVFYSVPVIVAIVLPCAFMAGTSVWFIIGLAGLTSVAHMIYGSKLDAAEVAAPAKVVQLVQSA